MKTKMSDPIKAWYQFHFKSDTVGEFLNAKVTFRGLYEILQTNASAYIYDFLFVDGYSDSHIRETIFNQLSELLNVDYDVIYKLWLNK